MPDSEIHDIQIHVNGETKCVPGGRTVGALLDWLSVPSERVAVEMNKSIVRKRDWQKTLVEPNASIEIVEFVGGG